MFERPTKGEIDRALSTLLHEARHRLAERRNEAMAEATNAGALQTTRLIIVVAEAAEKIHVEIMQQATSMLREFVQCMDIAPSQITEWARPQLENLGSTLLGVVPPCGFPDEQKRIVAQYQAQFDQRLTGALRYVCSFGCPSCGKFATFEHPSINNRQCRLLARRGSLVRVWVRDALCVEMKKVAVRSPVRRRSRDFGRCLLFASGPPVATDALVQRYW